MSQSRLERAKELLDAALAMPPSERRRFIAAQSGGDDSLRSEVEGLLRAHEDAGVFLPSSGGGAVDRVAQAALDAADTAAEGPGDRIGRYKLLQSIGEGGFGEVFMAEQQEPVRRIVALKVIKAGMDTKEVIARFEAERQALALMDHPNIAKVLDAGATGSGRPYFVMELVKGVSITEFCDSNRLSMRDRLELFVSVCKAVDHAHERGVIHRDIKPSNVLVTFVDGTPAPMVIDFGIAKATSQRLTERTLFTMFGQFVGTPTYMSPEQAALSNQEVDRRCDVYSLGVLLYELMTGTTPFEGDGLRSAAFLELLRIIREVDPPTPSHRVSSLGARGSSIAERRGTELGGLSKILRGDLDWIVIHALEKDRRRRYSTASEFAADIERHFRNEPIVARQPSLTYRAAKFARRHSGPLIAGAILATVTGVALGTIVTFRQTAQRRDAVQLLLARGLELQRSGEAMAAKRDLSFERALTLADSAYAEAARQDPSSARPVVQRGKLAYRRSRLAGRDTGTVRRWADVGLEHATHAFALDSMNADALETRGNIEYWTWLLNMAGDSAAGAALLHQARFNLEKAVALNPRQAGAWASLSHLYYNTDQTGATDVIDAARRAIEADSLVDTADLLLNRLFFASYDMGMFADASRYCASLHGRFPNALNGWRCTLYLLTTDLGAPDVALAWQLADSVVTRAPASRGDYFRRNTSIFVAAVLARASQGERALGDSARRVVARAMQGPAVDPVDAADRALSAAFVYVLLGDHDSAFRQLRAAVSSAPALAKRLAADPGWWFRPVEKDPRFAQLVRGP